MAFPNHQEKTPAATRSRAKTILPAGYRSKTARPVAASAVDRAVFTDAE
jgi:hypothetical protein